MSATEPHDGDLLRSWHESGSEQSFHQLVARYAGLVRQCARRSSGDPMIADEAAQLTFILLARKARSLQSRSSLGGWLHTTALLQTRNLMRTQHRENRKRLAITAMIPTNEEFHSSAWKEMGPVLDTALAALRQDDREAILLRFHRGLSYADVASALGIAGDTARKRVDRAVERLRMQLQRRGCCLGTSACVGALGLFAADAQAAGAAAPFFSSQALVAATAAGSTTLATTTIAIIMTKKTTIAAAAVLLFAGAGAVAIIKKDDAKQPASEQTADRRPTRPEIPASEGSGSSVLRSQNSPAPLRDSLQHPDLVERYGQSRTDLATHVASNIIGLFEDIITTEETFINPNSDISTALGEIYDQLDLTEDQQAAADKKLADFRKREIAGKKEIIGKLREDKTLIMRLLLTSDSASRGVTEEDINNSELEAEADHLFAKFEFAEGDNVLMGNAAFATDFKALLSPEQAGTFQSYLDKKAAAAVDDGKEDTDMFFDEKGLEETDQLITKTKEMLSSMMRLGKGIGALKELQQEEK